MVFANIKLTYVTGKYIKLKRSMLAMFAAIMASLFLISTAAYASDQTVVFTEDPADAEKGKVYIGAIIEKGFKGEVTMELYPDFQDGSIHQYILSKENNYLVSDDIMTGTYEAVAYLSGGNQENGKTATATYGGIPLKVRPGNEDAPYFAAVAGSSSFVEEYGWLSYYATRKGPELCGPVTWQGAKALFQETIALQDHGGQDAPEPKDDTAVWEPETDIAKNSPPVTPDSKEDETPGNGGNLKDESPAKRTDGWKIPAAAAAICILAGCGIFMWRRGK